MKNKIEYIFLNISYSKNLTQLIYWVINDFHLECRNSLIKEKQGFGNL